MAKKGNLFFLIQSLNKSEKRYFKIFCFGQKVNKNYLRLFEAISTQSDYDEAAIRRKFVGEDFVRQLHVTKNYLYRLILKSLRNFHQKSSPKAEVRSFLHNIELLFNRELYDHCHYEILKAERIARQNELQTALIDLADWKRKLHLALHQRQTGLLDPFNQMEEKAIKNLEQVNRYWYYSDHIFDYGKDTDGKLLQDELFASPTAPEHLQANILHHHILYTYFIINGQPETAYDHLLQQIQTLESQSEWLEHNPSLYLSALNNQISFLIRRREYEAAILLLEKIRNIAKDYKGNVQKLTVRTLLRSYNMELEVYRDTRDTLRGMERIHEVEHFLEKHRAAIPQEYYLLLWYQFAHLYLMQKDYYAALHWVNAIIDTRFKEGRKELERFARLLNLVIHFELGNTMVLRYSVDHSRRFLKKQKQIAPYEKVLLQFFSKASKSPKAEFPALLRQLHGQLFSPEAPLVDGHILDYFDFGAWLKEKGIC